MKMKYLFLLAVGLVISYSASAQESKFKALFIYKFAEYIEWPYDPGVITIGVAGKSEVYDHLVSFAASRSNIEVLQLESEWGTNKCNIVFLADAAGSKISDYKSKIGDGSILLISENMSLVSQGADIGFYVENGKLQFIINEKSIISKKMTPSSKLLALGKSI